MRIILTGGGTGGHIYPALAVAERLQALHPDCEILYVGTDRGLEKDIVPKRNLPFRTIHAEGLPRKLTPALLKAVKKSADGCLEARKIVKSFQPDVVIGTGGYVCGPVVLAAKLQGVPTMIHEQNAFPGITNKLLARFANCIMVNFEESKKYFVHKERIKVTGLPVRQEVLAVEKNESLAYFGFSAEKTTLLVSGGSRGARSLNRAMVDAYPELLKHPDLQIIHLTGKTDYEDTMTALQEKGIAIADHPQVVIKSYLDEMQYGLGAADFCVGRAGATFLAEVTACGLPCILIPYPYAAENHQEYNAKALVEQNAASMILDKDLTGSTLCRAVLSLYQNSENRKQMAAQSFAMGKRDALAQIVGLVEQQCAESCVSSVQQKR
ncbi:MAG: undecaprenyldiphospho-muramoylpentapeptide beta-N-acetylglucosaminyltransferase [Peptococcaceae bacterium]|nr:undecaprenyldiphospho-muramoylpentapeptide beta-N-acetylglucosaminyltransferase [Peptococcaceae bacterium]